MLFRVNVCGGVPTPGLRPRRYGGCPWPRVLREDLVYDSPAPAPGSWLSRMLAARVLIRVGKDGTPLSRAPSRSVPPLAEEDLAVLYGSDPGDLNYGRLEEECRRLFGA